MLVDFLDPCLTCGARGWVGESQCPSCVGGRVVSESVIEEMGRAIHEFMRYHDWPKETLPRWSDETDEWQEYVRGKARAVARVVLEHMEDK